MAILAQFFIDAIKILLRGPRLYWIWVGSLSAIFLIGIVAYGVQLTQGLVVSGLSDQVSWGAYIANFAFLVGVAAAAVMLVIPGYIFNRSDIKRMVLIGEGIAVAAVVMCMLFVTVDLGRPDRIWHMIPLLGRFNFPYSLLAWDVVVLTGYLFLNLLIPFYILFAHYRGKEPDHKAYFPWVVLSIAWAISIHTVTAFLFSSNVGREFWHTAVLGPRFLASAFSSGPALIIIALQIIHQVTDMKVEKKVMDTLTIVVTVALQINLFLLGAELFTEFYFPTEHIHGATFLFFGLKGYNTLVPWIWTAISFNVIAATMLTLHPLRNNTRTRNFALGLLIVGVWIEKGMGLIIPGFVPTPIGEVFQYIPSLVELAVSLGVWALGLLIFTFLAKVAIPIELGQLRYNGKTSEE